MKLKIIFIFDKTRYYRYMTYNTRQKEAIISLIQSKKTDFSVKEIYQELVKSGEEIGQTTIYRIIDGLVAVGQLQKTLGSDGSARFQFLEACDHFGHCYLKCNDCGKLEHVDCEDLCDLTEHIKRQHKFAVDEANIVISGKCRSCQ